MNIYRIKLLILISLSLVGCSTIQNKRLPFSTFAGKEVTLLRPCVLTEYITGMSSVLSTYWEQGQPTELVFDDRLFTKPARVIPAQFGESKLYPASDYHKRVYSLREKSDPVDMAFLEQYGGPYREYAIPAGERVFITKAYTYNAIDSVSQQAAGKVTKPGTDKKVTFTYAFKNFPESRGTLQEYIGRAPWEDESVPEKRFVGWNGKMYQPR